MRLRLELIGHYSNGGPECVIELNSENIWSGILAQSANILEFDMDPMADNILRIHHKNKSNNDTIVENNEIVADKAIEIKNIFIQDIQVLSNVLYNKRYYVSWPQNIIEEYLQKRQLPPAYLTNTLYLGYNGFFEFDFIGEFQKEYYKQFWYDEEQAHYNLTTTRDSDGELVETFERFGTEVSIDQEFNLTIHDLSEMINNDPDF